MLSNTHGGGDRRALSGWRVWSRCGLLRVGTSWAMRWSGWRSSCVRARRLGTISLLCRSICRPNELALRSTVKSESGPDHRKRFLVEVRLKTAEGKPGKPLARGIGTTKKHAEQDAARRALARLTSTTMTLNDDVEVAC